MRVDPNQGCDAAQVRDFVEGNAAMDVEFLEQPMAANDVTAMRALDRPGLGVTRS